MDFTERDECKPVLLELSLARNLVKRLISLYGTECREFCSAWIPLPERTTTPAQAVFGSALILPDRFLDFAELPSDEFPTQFSLTLSAAEHNSTRRNTTASRRPPLKLPGKLAPPPTVLVWRNSHVPPSSRSTTAPTPSCIDFCTASPCRWRTRQTRCPPSD